MVTVLWDLITSPLPISFRMSFNLIWITTKKREDYCQLLQIKLKNVPSLGKNAPDQFNKLFPIWTHTPRTLNLKKNPQKKQGKHPVFHLNWTCMKFTIENKLINSRTKKRKSVWHNDMEFQTWKNKVHLKQLHARKTFCFSFCGMFPFLMFLFQHLPLVLQWECDKNKSMVNLGKEKKMVQMCVFNKQKTLPSHWPKCACDLYSQHIQNSIYFLDRNDGKKR